MGTPRELPSASPTGSFECDDVGRSEDTAGLEAALSATMRAAVLDAPGPPEALAAVRLTVPLHRTYALQNRVDGRKTAHEELLEQLAILETESTRIRAAVYARDVNALSDQSRFLRGKFGRSELEL